MREHEQARRTVLLTLTMALSLAGSSCSRTDREDTAAAPASPPPSSSAPAGGADRSVLPPGHAPVAGMGGSAHGGEQGAVISWTTPEGWKQEAPSSGMRYAQFRVPGVDGDPDDAECAVFYFGAGQGGSPKDNAARWVGQFVQPDGSSSESRSKTELKTVGGKEVMFVEVTGTYTASMAGMPAAEPKKDYALLGAIVPGPDAPWFFKLTGPRRTVSANKEAFTALVASIH